MSIGDGSTWDETNPTDATIANQIDDYNRDLRVGIRSRLSREHEFPSSQSSTSQAGAHKFITLQAQSVKPTLSGTQVGAVYVTTDTPSNLMFENSAGTVIVLDKPIPSGGTANQVLSKIDSTDYNTQWVTPSVQVGLGTWTTTASAGTSYLASTDLFVSAVGGNGVAYAIIYTDSSNPPTTKRAINYASGEDAGCCCMVKKGDYWKVSFGAGAGSIINVISVGQ